MSKKKISVGAAILIAVAAIFITFQITYVTIGAGYSKRLSDLKAQYSKFDKLLEVDDIIESSFLWDFDSDEAMDNMLRAYLNSLGDKYSYYMSSSEFESLMSEMNSEVTGIGIKVVYDADRGVMDIISVVEGSPAEEVGVLPGDALYSVEGNLISEIGYYEALSLMKGAAGTSVSFAVYRGEESIDFTAERRVMTEKTVSYHIYKEQDGSDTDIGIIEISEFDVNTSEEFKAAVSALMGSGAKKLIFDVRNNPGGELESILKTLDYLLPKGPLINIEDANGKIETRYSDDSYLDCEVAVLVNENTASAAELFSSALQDYTKNGQYNAKLIGTTTYGKGIMQTVIKLSDGSGISLTYRKYNPPYSENYHGVGVKPDYEVELSDEAKQINFYKLNDYNDNQLQYAVRLLTGN